jgi:hypothetical protein
MHIPLRDPRFCQKLYVKFSHDYYIEYELTIHKIRRIRLIGVALWAFKAITWVRM